jgi:hypothetical protein
MVNKAPDKIKLNKTILHLEPMPTHTLSTNMPDGGIMLERILPKTGKEINQDRIEVKETLFPLFFAPCPFQP